MTRYATRARTIAATATSVRLGVLDRGESLFRHALAVDGSLLFLPPPGSPLLAAGLLPVSPAVSAVLVDVAPVPTADRVRGRVVLTGRPRPVERRLPPPLVSFLCGEETAPGRHLLELRPDSVHLDWFVEGHCSVAVPPEEYAAAQPDPLAGWEPGFLRHLHDEHAGLLGPLAAGLGLDVGPDDRLRPVVADADGLVLRATGPARAARDLRLPYGRPATCGCDAVEAFNSWLSAAQVGGAGQT